MVTTSEIYVRELGAGPTILMVHGTPSPAEMFMPLARTLASTHRVLVPDLPGYGRSPAPDDASFDTVGKLLIRMLEQRGIERLHGIVGYSGGTYRGLHLALRLGLEVDRLAFIGPLADLDDATRTGFHDLADLIDRDPTVVKTDLQSLVATRNLSAAWLAAHPEDVTTLGRWLTLSPPRSIAAELRAFSTLPSLLSELPQLRARLYLRVGELDIATPPASSLAIAKRAPNVKLDVIAGCAHALLIEDAEATERAIVDELCT